MCALMFAIYFATLLELSNASLTSSNSSTTNTSGKTAAIQNQVASSRTVTTKYGILRGLIITLPNRNLQQVEVFLGIPYASAPTGKLRLMPPVTAVHWSGIRNAHSIAPSCPQSSNLHLNLTSEDCLYFNIYTPISVHQHAIKLPVMVFIHGGNFDHGSGSDFDGSVLAAYGNVLVVTINYRLGLLGFFPTLDSTARGNYGLMDQVAALHWIQENIGEFGGLSQNVTVFGVGSGAACIQLLMLSPMAKNLFQRAILQSGNALSPLYPASTLNTLRNAKQIAAQLQCFAEQTQQQRHYLMANSNNGSNFSASYIKNGADANVISKFNLANTNNLQTSSFAKASNLNVNNKSSSKEHKPNELLECLRKHKLDKLLDLSVKQPKFLFKFSPTLEGILLPLDLIKSMTDKNSNFLNYDLMIGINSFTLNDYFDVNTPSYANFAQTDTSPSSIHNVITEERKNKIMRTLVRNLYTYHLQEIYMTLSNEYRNWNNSSLENKKKLTELLNDALLIAPSIKTAILHSKSTSRNTFVYNYVASGELNKDKNTDQLKNSNLLDELLLIFGQPLVPSLKLIQYPSKQRNYSNLEVKLSEKLMHYWTNFARFGDPNIKFRPQTRHHSSLMANSLSSLVNIINYVEPSSLNHTVNDILNRNRNKHWPLFNEQTQLYLNINLYPTVASHMRSHELSFILNLLPKLNRPTANNMQLNEHHLLDDHHNLNTYEGVVREHPSVGLTRTNAIDFEDQLASKKMLELLLSGEKQLDEQFVDEQQKLNRLMKIREKLLKWKFISEQNNVETQKNYDELIKKLTSKIEGVSSSVEHQRNTSVIILEDNKNSENFVNNVDKNTSNDLKENLEMEQNQIASTSENQLDKQGVHQNLKQVNSNSYPKSSDEINYHLQSNESYSMIIQDGNYSTILSITIIVGCSLLFLNILVFAGVFLNRESGNCLNHQNSSSIDSQNSSTITNHLNLNNNLEENTNLTVANSIYLNNGNLATQSTINDLNVIPNLTNIHLNNTLNNVNIKAFQSDSLYIPYNNCDFEQNHHQDQQSNLITSNMLTNSNSPNFNSTILTLKRNETNKNYIANTPSYNQLKRSIELSDYNSQNSYLNTFINQTENTNLNKGNINNSLSDQQNSTTLDCLTNTTSNCTTTNSSGLGSSLNNVPASNVNLILNNVNQSSDLLCSDVELSSSNLIKINCSSLNCSSPSKTLSSTPDYFTDSQADSTFLNVFSNNSNVLDPMKNMYNYQPSNFDQINSETAYHFHNSAKLSQQCLTENNFKY